MLSAHPGEGMSESETGRAVAMLTMSRALLHRLAQNHSTNHLKLALDTHSLSTSIRAAERTALAWCFLGILGCGHWCRYTYMCLKSHWTREDEPACASDAHGSCTNGKSGRIDRKIVSESREEHHQGNDRLPLTVSAWNKKKSIWFWSLTSTQG